uniref:NADH-ubiquinone oxidoreductase chain 6 n=1 Tax=Neogymnocrinus richeri TaxID=710152 RepID=Q2QJE5_9ECHI|nr:NADH dehydrogenase subunit 6 [Neogymnocrinus richeri]AAY51821.1 NADH dehydrogenase subunit 6 [Neogymnocrinus richeri]
MSLYISVITLLFGSSFVFYSLSPYYSALGLAIVSISGCLILTHISASFLALILLLVYMGGMLVVFVYSSALSTDRFPYISNTAEIISLSFFIIVWTTILYNNTNWNTTNTNFNLTSLVDIEGASYLFHQSMILFFILAGYILLIALIIVLDISRGVEETSLRAL